MAEHARPVVGRRAVVRLLGAGTAVALVPLVPLLAGCGPVQVSTVGGPVGRAAAASATARPPSPSVSASVTPSRAPTSGASAGSSSTASPTASSPSPSSPGADASGTPSPSATVQPTVPPLVSDLTSLDGSFLLFQAPSSTAGWRKTLGTTVGRDIRTYYTDDAQALHLTVEIVAPLGISPLAHARQLAAIERARQPGYAERAVGPGAEGSAVWAFTYPSTILGPRYGIDWFQVFPAFDAAVYVEGPTGDEAMVKSLWRAVVASVTLPTPYQSQSGTLQRLLTRAPASAATTSPGSP